MKAPAIYNVTGDNMHFHGTVKEAYEWVNSRSFPCYAMSEDKIIAWHTAGEDISGYHMGYMGLIKGIQF